MKLRIKGDSLRLRIAPSEMAQLVESGRIEETVHLGLEDSARLTYSLELAEAEAITVRHEGTALAVILPNSSARAWAGGEDVGIYGTVAVSSGSLDIAVEKDWACLDKSDGDNADTFPNPRLGVIC
jgi:hypothetical protein